MVIISGCDKTINENNDKIAYISVNSESDHKKTFDELNLGIIYDFNLNLPRADKSWVEIWVEAYKDGELVEPAPLAELSYGMSPVQLQEGNVGMGIINPDSDEIQFLLYGSGGVLRSPVMEDNIFTGSGISSWDYAIGNTTVELDSGEEKLLAVYRQAENQLRTYDYQDSDSLDKMIKEDQTVLLLKIKVEERSGS